MSAKPWGWWTKHKLQILGEYLQAFARASQKSEERIYLDLFAGWPENRDRLTDDELLGSVPRALAVTPAFTRVCLFELGKRKAARLAGVVRGAYPGRNGIEVYPGDCNERISDALRDLREIRWAPTFAFIDQFDNEVSWETLRSISRFRPQPQTKAEMWILFGTGFYARGLNVGQELMNAQYAETLTQMLGSEEWVPIIEARRRGRLAPAQMRNELVNLMRWRLECVLGYRESHAFTMKNTNNNDLYDMIFVSDHPVGDKIMRHLYGRGMQEHEAMRQYALHQRRDARRAATGVAALFPVEETMIQLPDREAAKVYRPEPPQVPYGQR